jgi:D-alanyl-D-alanine dipeptidase
MLNKIVLNRYISILAIVKFIHGVPACSQQAAISKYGVATVNNIAVYQQIIHGDSSKRMVELKKLMPGIVYDLRYGTNNNFMHRPMYSPPPHTTFLRLPAAQALAKIQKELSSKGYGLKIFDAYRPYSVTVAFWELVHDEQYVANPSKGSGHNRGLAVDCTIINLSTKQELDMGTGFDNFTDSAHHAFLQLPQAVLQNRRLLKETMEKYGFTALNSEWWHYFWPNNREYEVLDIPFNQLATGN